MNIRFGEIDGLGFRYSTSKRNNWFGAFLDLFCEHIWIGRLSLVWKWEEELKVVFFPITKNFFDKYELGAGKTLVDIKGQEEVDKEFSSRADKSYYDYTLHPEISWFQYLGDIVEEYRDEWIRNAEKVYGEKLDDDFYSGMRPYEVRRELETAWKMVSDKHKISEVVDRLLKL